MALSTHSTSTIFFRAAVYVTVVLLLLYVVFMLPYYSVYRRQNRGTAKSWPASQEGNAENRPPFTKVGSHDIVLKLNQGKPRPRSNRAYVPPQGNNSLNSTNLNVDSQPMAMALNYWEQQGTAIDNLCDLQCWASTVGITKVMEPFIFPASSTTVFGFVPKIKGLLTFRDLLNIDAWNSMSLNHSFSTLVSPQSFLDNAVKEMVYVQLIYTDYGGQCQSMDDIMRKGWYKFLTTRGFHIVQNVCINFRKEPNHNTMTQEAFRDRIFGKSDGNLTVVFNNWHGIRDYNDVAVRRECTFRIPITGTHCSAVMYKMADAEIVSSRPANVKYAHGNHSSPIVLNSRLSNYVKQFKSEFMSGVDYVAVMMRTERMNSNLFSESNNNPCMAKIVSDWKKMTNEATNNSTTLFFSDIGGGHGSSNWGNHAARRFSDKVQRSVGIKHNLSDVNRYLEKIMGTTNSVLIAAIHREIIAQAKCAIVVGGGIFQRQTLHMFAQYHKDVELCYSLRNSYCESQYISLVYDDLYYDLKA